MAETNIEWADYTFNPWMGCTKVAPGCTHCYAETFSKRYGKATWGPGGTRVKTSDANWAKPIKWNKASEASLRLNPNWVRPLVFCASLADVFEDWDGPVLDHHGLQEFRYSDTGKPRSEWVPLTMHDLRRLLFNLIDATPNLDWLLLTKRPENVRRFWPAKDTSGPEARSYAGRSVGFGEYRSNVWLGTSVSLQSDLDAANWMEWEGLAAHAFLSVEPLLGPVDLQLPFIKHPDGRIERTGLIDWVIVGGESGGSARPMNTTWVWSIVQQCKAAGVACFVKQMGANSYLCIGHDRPMFKGDDAGPPVDCLGEARGCVKFRLAGKKGGDMAEWPEGLRVRQFPEVAHVCDRSGPFG